MLRRRSKSSHTGPDLAAPAAGQFYELIASRAYELYELRGAGPDDELTDWLAAEREILANTPKLRAEAADSVGDSGVVPAPTPRKKTFKVMSIGGSRKKAGPTTPRSTAKPKGTHP